MKAMILAAGIGTRLRPLTNERPKALIEIQGVPLLEHSIRYLKFHGVKDIIINVHHFAGQIIDFLEKNKSFGLNIAISDEQSGLLDTGGGLFKAREFFNDDRPFFLMASDVITDLDLNLLYQFHLDHNPLVTLAVKHRTSTREFLFSKDHRLCGWHNNINGDTRWVDKPVDNAQKIGFSTIHVIDPRLFGLVTETGAFSIIEMYLRLAKKHSVLGFEHDNTAWFEFGRIENLGQLNVSAEIQAIFRKFHN